MRFIIIGLLSIVSFTINAQDMEKIKEVVTKMFVSTDQKKWSGVESCFANKVVLDYSSMTGNPAEELSPQAITTSWKGILPGFESTHHQLGNMIVKTNGDKAELFCYGTATHYLTDEGGNIWTVVGSYDFDLNLINNEWKITKMKFNFKYQDGNTSLPGKAIELVKSKNL